jgi:hypothetical protein
MEYLVPTVFHLGIAIALGGMIVLVAVIPLIGKLKTFTSVRTEFYSARAAYWCVLTGLGMLLIMTLSIAIHFSIVPLFGAH